MTDFSNVLNVVWLLFIIIDIFRHLCLTAGQRPLFSLSTHRDLTIFINYFTENIYLQVDKSW